MTYDLYIGDRTFSSWSLRGWLMLEKFGLAYQSHVLGLYSGTLQADLADLAPARTVPVLKTPEGHILTDTIAMAETLAERHPDAGLWPSDPTARALARSLVAEMHSGFGALRGDCPMMLAHGWAGYQASDAVLADVARLEKLWDLTRTRHGGDGPWLFGRYTLADVFYAPAVTRLVTYGLPVGATAQAYIETTLRDPAFQAWRAAGLTQTYEPMPYRQEAKIIDWPNY